MAALGLPVTTGYVLGLAGYSTFGLPLDFDQRLNRPVGLRVLPTPAAQTPSPGLPTWSILPTISDFAESQADQLRATQRTSAATPEGMRTGYTSSDPSADPLASPLGGSTREESSPHGATPPLLPSQNSDPFGGSGFQGPAAAAGVGGSANDSSGAQSGNVPPPPFNSATSSPPANAPTATTSPTVRRRIATDFGQTQMRFEANQGQSDPSVQFLARGAGSSLFFNRTETVIALNHPATGPSSPARDVVRLQLVGSSPTAQWVGQQPLATRSNYFLGRDRARWQADVPNYARVAEQGVYPGVDLLYYGNSQRKLEFDFVVAPGADPGIIRFAVQGPQRISLNARGDLVLHTGGGDLIQQAPVMYQDINGARQFVSGRFVLGGGNQVGFQVGAYDRIRPLTIDPVIDFSTYFGGSEIDEGYAIAVDSVGQTYLTGKTTSPDLPTLPASGRAYSTGDDVYVAALSSDGSQLLYSTYIGGGGDEAAYGIAVDAGGNAYIAGRTSSADFPTTGNAVQTALAGVQNAFVTELSPQGDVLTYSTFLGGHTFAGPNQTDQAKAIAVDGNGLVYITGGTNSADFPLAGPIQSSPGGGLDAFVSVIDPTLPGFSGLRFSSYFGGSQDEQGSGIAVGPQNQIYLTGSTASPDFRLRSGASGVGGYQTSFGSGSPHAFILGLAPLGAGYLYSTFLGGEANDQGNAIAVDANGDVFVTGSTTSSSFPITAQSPASGIRGGSDAFVSMLDPTGTVLLASTILGGSADDRGNGIALNVTRSGRTSVFVTGTTSSSDFFTLAAPQSMPGGGQDAFVAQLNVLLDQPGTKYALQPFYSTYLGGLGDDQGNGIATDLDGNVYVAGTTTSQDFPTSADPLQGTNRGIKNAFVTQIGFRPPVVVDDSASTNENTPVTVNVLGNDSSPDGQDLWVAWVTDHTLAGGTVTINEDNTVTYLPYPGFIGTDTFSYLADNGAGGLGSFAQVTVTIQPVNYPPAVYVGPGETLLLGEAVSVNSLFTSNDPGPFSASVTWGDGASEVISGPVLPDTALQFSHHTYAVAGTYPVVVGVVDQSTGLIGSATESVVVTGNLPVPIGAHLRSVTFSGDHFHTMFSDDAGNPPFLPPHWLDLNGNGSTNDPGDRALPVIYTRNSFMMASATFDVDLSLFPSGALVRGTGSGGIDIPASQASLVGYQLILQPMRADRPFANQVDFFEPFSIAWEISTDGGSTWTPAGTSRNPIYIPLGDPQTIPYETLALTTKAARAAATPTELVAGVWANFSNRQFKDPKNQPLKYYGNWGNANDATNREDLLKNKDGICTAWADLFRKMVIEAGVDKTSIDRCDLSSKFDDSGFLIKSWTFQLNPVCDDPDYKTFKAIRPYVNYYDMHKMENRLPGSPIQGIGYVRNTYAWANPPAANVKRDPTAAANLGGQNQPTPKAHFSTHQVVKFGNKYYDPSYGKVYSPAGATDAARQTAFEKDFETQSVDGYWKIVANSTKYRDPNTKNFYNRYAFRQVNPDQASIKATRSVLDDPPPR